MSKRILFISHRTPYPPNKGDKIRSFNFIRYLSSRYELHLAFIVDDRDDLKHIRHLEKYSKSIAYQTISPTFKKITSAFKAVFSSQPISVPYFYSRKLQNKIDALVKKELIDIVFCFSSPTAEYLYMSKYYNTFLKKVTWIMDLVDVDSHKWRQYAETVRLPLRWLYMREARFLAEYERQIITKFQYVLLISEQEKRLLDSYEDSSNIVIVSNGVDTKHFAPTKELSKKSDHTIMFSGVMDYWPNIDGVKWFVASILPQIRKEVPGVQFQIVGSKPTSEIKNLALLEGVSVTGFVEDIRDYIGSADVCVIPLRIARGIQNKVLEAMAMGKAVVCTREAKEGIKASSGSDLIVAEDTATFAHAVIMLLNNKTLRDKIGRNGRRCMENNYSWENCLNKLDNLIGDM